MMHTKTNHGARSRALGGLLLTLLLFGCTDMDLRPEAIGPEGQITVVIDSARWAGPVGHALRDRPRYAASPTR